MSNIYNYIVEQEEGFRKEIPMEYGWYWSFKNHVRRSFLYKHSQFEENNDNREQRPNKNIIRPILNVQYRTEGFDVKDIEIYVNNPDHYYKSFLVKKYYEKWARQNDIDTFIDDLVESYVDYGGALVKNVKGVRPEVVDLRTIAFCDQTDILSGPFAIKHYYTASQLRKKTQWDSDMIEFLITKAEAKKHMDKEDEETKTPGKYIEIYEIHNVSPSDFDVSSRDTEPYIYICGLYTGQDGREDGVTLFKNREPKLPFKMLKRDPIKGRALGWGGIEELFEPQVWTNYAEIHIAGMLENASKVLYLTTDRRFKGQNLRNKKSGEVLDIQTNADIRQLDTVPRNFTVFKDYTMGMHEHAMEMGAASDIFMGQQPNSGTPFKSLESQLIEGKSLHLWRQGRIATFVDEIHRDWIIPGLAADLRKGDKFLSELSADEMMALSEAFARTNVNALAKQALLEGRTVTQDMIDSLSAVQQAAFVKRGNKKFLEIMKDELADDKLDVYTNIAGKQKNMAQLTDKMVNTVRQLIATPELRQDAEMIKWLNSIFESSGMSPITFSPRTIPVKPQGTGNTEGLKDLAQANEPSR